MQKKLSLKTKLLSAFMGVGLFVMAVAATGYFSLNKVYQEYHYIVSVIMNAIENVNGLNELGSESNRLVLRASIAPTEADYQRIRGKYTETVSSYDKLEQVYRSTEWTPGEEAKYLVFKADWDNYIAEANTYFKMMDTRLPAQKETAIARLDNEFLKARAKMSVSKDELVKFLKSVSSEKAKIASEAYHLSNWLLVVASVTGVILSLAIGYIFSMSISKKLTEISQHIMNSAQETSAGSTQLTSASSQLSQGATESAASLEETVSSLEELSSMVKLNSDHAKEANSLSQKSLQAAEHGEHEIVKLISAMGDMSKSSRKIEEIINVIDDIAFQTNLLALNAAVEAARAGEQGKGFAVVADAVRNLAQRSASAAKDINSLIKENVSKTEDGSKIADLSGSSLKEILNSVKKVADLNSEIAAASQEQANGIEQISKAMNHLDQATQSNASSSEEVASSAQEMSSQASLLANLVSELESFVKGFAEEAAHAAHTPHTQERKKPHNVVAFRNKNKAAHEVLPLSDSDKNSSIGKAEGF